jgi:hypothetical protein
MTPCSIVPLSRESALPQVAKKAYGLLAFFRNRMLRNLLLGVFISIANQLSAIVEYALLSQQMTSAVRSVASYIRTIAAKFGRLPNPWASSFQRRRGALDEKTVHIRWFFSDWSHAGRWHDTEVLVAESDEHFFIIFRGTDSVADVMTNAQTYITASRADFVGNVSEGSLHRGFLGAYRTVDSGKIILVSPSRNSALEPIYSVYSACRGINSSAVAICQVSDVNLRRLLLSVIHLAVGGPKKLILSGHSLGGALATLLAIDLLANQDLSSNARDWLQLHLQLITFGAPDFADTSFYTDIMKNYPHFNTFLHRNDLQYVGLSKSPMCGADLVSSALDLANGLFGDVLMGRGGGVWGRMRLRSQLRQKLQVADHELVNSNTESRSFRFKSQYESTTMNPISQFIRPGSLYVSSGHAASKLSAHSMPHYLQGIVWAMNDNSDAHGRVSFCDSTTMYEIFGLDQGSIRSDGKPSHSLFACLIASDLKDEVVAAQMLHLRGTGAADCYTRDPNGRYFLYLC